MNLAARWDRYWFAPASPLDLGIGRAFACAIFLVWVLVWGDDQTAWASVPPTFWQPIECFRWTGLPVFPASVLSVLRCGLILALLAGALGVWSRVSCLVAFVLSCYLMGLSNCFGKIDHAETIVPLVLLVLACSRCGDAAALFPGRSLAGLQVLSPEYTWPVKAVWLLTSLVFFAAGWAKITTSGIGWVTSDSMRYILLAHHYIEGGRLPGISLWMADQPWLYHPLAACGMGFEFCAPLALVSRRARVIIMPGLFGMLLSFWFLFGFSAVPFYALFVFWVPWNSLMQRLRRPVRALQESGPPPMHQRSTSLPR